MIEQTLSIIKPDAVERNLDNKIKYFFQKNNLKILKSKKVKISKEEASEFYKVHQTKPFYNELCNYLSSGPIVVMVLEGENAVSRNRELMGATDPLKAKDGTLRKLYGISIDKNSVASSFVIFTFFIFATFKLFSSKNFLISSSKFLSTASGFIIDNVCSIIVFIHNIH